MDNSCEEQLHLWNEVTRAGEAYSRAAKALRAARHGDHAMALDNAEQTSSKCGKARRALQAHILKHRCWKRPAVSSGAS